VGLGVARKSLGSRKEKLYRLRRADHAGYSGEAPATIGPSADPGFGAGGNISGDGGTILKNYRRMRSPAL
jgi:hypothetical protein